MRITSGDFRPRRPVSGSGSYAAPRTGDRLILPNTQASTKSTFRT
jgi:hypothetical protein